jgi:hypothetical protein
MLMIYILIYVFLHPSMHMCMCACVCVCIYWLLVHMCFPNSVRQFVYMYIYKLNITNDRVYICTYMYTQYNKRQSLCWIFLMLFDDNVCMYVCMCVCVYICAYVTNGQSGILTFLYVTKLNFLYVCNACISSSYLSSGMAHSGFEV